MPSLGLLKRKEVWFPTWRGWFLLLLVSALGGVGLVASLAPFLAPIHPLHGSILIVEGWLPDYALEQARNTFTNGTYRLLIVTGIPIDQGYHITREKNFAQLGATTLKHLGLKEEVLVPITCPKVPRDRTYATARKVRAWLDARPTPETIDVFTLGVHARRTWLLYRTALGERYRAGVIAAADQRFDNGHWWKTSAGFRTVTSEAIAYLYAKLLFRPNSTEALEAGGD